MCKLIISFFLFFSCLKINGQEKKINLIDEANLTYKNFSICEKLDRSKFKTQGFYYKKSRYIKPSYSKYSYDYMNPLIGVEYEFDDKILHRILIYFPCQDTTLRGIHVGCTKEQVIKAYGAVKATCGSDCISYGNLDFMLCNNLVYGIELWGDVECESK